MNLRAIILAAGKGTRMKSDLPKVLHQVGGAPMIEHVINHLNQADVNEIYAVLGHKASQVAERLGSDIKTVLQEEQLGTGHAVKQFEAQLEGVDGQTIVICGDTPLISSETIAAFIKHHTETNAQATVLTAQTETPFGYGRIIRNSDGTVERIVEEKDATDKEREVQEINTGTFIFDNRALFESLKKVTNDNAQGEYYLPDVLKILTEQHEKIEAHQCVNFDETIGINDRMALGVAEKIMRQRINAYHQQKGVTLIDPETTYIGAKVEIGPDTIIYPGTVIEGDTSIGKGVHISAHCDIKDSRIADGVTIKQSVVVDSIIGGDSSIGPYAQLRPGSHLGSNVKVGNFVEVKKSELKDDVKVSHLSYIGDATIGENTNVGCGTITVNFDGKEKHHTDIGRDSFIGCNSNLIAPVKIGNKVFIAAGSTITRDVPDDSLAIARSRQENKDNYFNR